MPPGVAVEGMRVRLATGRTPMRVVQVFLSGSANEKLKCRYESDTSMLYENRYRARSCRDFVPISEDAVKEKTMPQATGWYSEKASEAGCCEIKETVNVAKLYQTKGDKPRFGTYLATNSQGKIVLEMKGTGDAEAFAQEDIEIVRPYTVSVKGDGGPSNYQVKQGSVAIGDVLIIGLNLMVVTGLDTKVDNSPELPERVRRIKTEPVE